MEMGKEEREVDRSAWLLLLFSRWESDSDLLNEQWTWLSSLSIDLEKERISSQVGPDCPSVPSCRAPTDPPARQVRRSRSRDLFVFCVVCCFFYLSLARRSARFGQRWLS